MRGFAVLLLGVVLGLSGCVVYDDHDHGRRGDYGYRDGDGRHHGDWDDRGHRRGHWDDDYEDYRDYRDSRHRRDR